MIFLPNTFERYIAALRVVYHLLILKSGINEKRLAALRRIYKIESLNFYTAISPFNIADFTLAILSAIQTLLNKNGKDFNFSVNANGVYLFNKQLFTLLLLEICTENNFVKISETPLGIIIFLNGEIKNSLPIIKKLKGYYFYEKLFSKGFIVLPFKKTTLTPNETTSEWYYLFDKFSPVNLYFL